MVQRLVHRAEEGPRHDVIAFLATNAEREWIGLIHPRSRRCVMSSMIDHDQIFKNLLEHFLSEFLELFFPKQHQKYDFSGVEFLRNEAFPDPPQGERQALDLVAKLRRRTPKGLGNAIVHIEIESPETMVPLRKRMCYYYGYLRGKYDLHVLLIALFLHVGGEGIGVEEKSYLSTRIGIHIAGGVAMFRRILSAIALVPILASSATAGPIQYSV